ncbi:MAG: quinone-dependent dihydroorotate dehydrogenase [Parvularcula sp.]
MSLWRFGTMALHTVDPELAHKVTVSAVKARLGPRRRNDRFPSLRTRIGNIDLPNPVGLAAGFDKNAEVPDGMLRMGFGFVEVGAVTPLPQPGNPRPRVFRLSADKAVINRYGFNNDGLDLIRERLARRHQRAGIVGVNLGANKTADDRVADYVKGVRALSPFVDFCTVNISSPNTPGLRALQGRDELDALLSSVLHARTAGTPVFLKIAPDLTDEDKADIAASVSNSQIDGLIISNTSVGLRDGLHSHKDEKGGLSGRPIFSLSTEVLRDFARGLTRPIPLIGVGGVSSAEEAYTKILNGASAIQLYTALVYAGPDLIPHILEGLNERLAVDGFAAVADAVGSAL